MWPRLRFDTLLENKDPLRVLARVSAGILRERSGRWATKVLHTVRRSATLQFRGNTLLQRPVTVGQILLTIVSSIFVGMEWDIVRINLNSYWQRWRR